MTRPRALRRALRLAPLAALLLAGACHAGDSRSCDDSAPPGAEQQSRLLRFASLIKSELEASGARVALVARSGLDLARFGQRYSHAGLSLLANPETAWSVRQLYFACDERRPRVFDQGLGAFVLGLHAPDEGYVSVLLLPSAGSTALERTALDNRQALALLGATYSANAYPFSLRYQNCNQWLAELLATAWAPADAGSGDDRERAQRWLQAQQYAPTVFDVGWRPLMWLGALIPHLHSDDHPAEDLAALRYRVSMPASLEAFVQRQVAGTRRLEFCHDGQRVVLRRDGPPIADGCVAGDGDTVVALH